MKSIKWYKGIALCVLSMRSTWADNEMSRSFFALIPPYQTPSPERDMFAHHDRIDMCDIGYGVVLHTSIFGGKMLDGEQLTKYFMPYGLHILNVLEFKQSVPSSVTDPNPERDLEARHFNIKTNQEALNTFQSRITFHPEQSLVGFGITLKKRLNRYACGMTKWWTEMSFPIVRVHNRLGLTEKVINDGGGVVDEIGLDGAPRVGNMIEAFKQSNWKFGKIDNSHKLEKTGVGDIEFKLGFNSRYGECCDTSSYIGLVIPTGNKPRGEYVFEPIVGNDHHYGFMFGGHSGFELWSYGDHAIRLESDMNSRMLFSNYQVRSFDLYDKQWSRYMEVYRTIEEAQLASISNNGNSGTSGINVFTRCMKIDPRFSMHTNTCFMYSYCNLMIEAGYNFYVRQSEKATITWKQGPALKHILGDGLISYARTVRDNFESTSLPITDYVPLTISDIDMRSAEHPAVLANMLYLGVGYNSTEIEYPVFFGVGGSYQFSTVNTALDQWLFFGKMGVSF